MPHYPHPITGRQDSVRTDPDWRARIERLEKQLGYVICGAKNRQTGEPCTNVPLDGQHRCKKHTPPQRRPNNRDALKYPSNVGYGMNLKQFSICRRCKYRDGCEYYTNDEDDECAIEKDIYANVMALRDKYTIDGDYLQTGLLDSVAFLLIHKFRAEMYIAMEGMVLDEVVGAYGDGILIKNKRQHPLLKHLMDINKQLNAYSKTMEFSPEAIHRHELDKNAIDAGNVLSDILKSAHEKRETH